MIYAILIFLENGMLLVEAMFEKLQLDNVLIAGFATAMNQFGIKIFPEDEELEDIVFTRHHIMFQKFRVQDKEIIMLNIHDKSEQHLILKKINQEIFWEIKQKFSHAFLKELIELNQFRGINERIEAIFAKEHRKEVLLK
ncbi:MAG: hypothetical protein GYA24_04530 [Candidatus Lokiarchaeota archaeon]|nr:hypothetical protein [Candidatus Lokiarchaeota archaeon]